jgi:dolichol-phosphate mannosyltransferase
MRPIVIVPTYNERENIRDLITTIRQEVTQYDLHILVVDSASPDLTSEVVCELQGRDATIFLIKQSAKLGLGTAYQEGMRWVLDRGYDRVITMDADFSHHPRYLESFLRESDRYDLVVGSRYVSGGELQNWPRSRRMLSRFANWYASRITGLPFSDLTSGFHCFHSDLLKLILKDPLRAEGYAFLIALKFLAVVHGAQCLEIPIIFSDRTKGESKISERVILESVFFVWKCFFQRHRLKKAKAQIIPFSTSEKITVLRD